MTDILEAKELFRSAFPKSEYGGAANAIGTAYDAFTRHYTKAIQNSNAGLYAAQKRSGKVTPAGLTHLKWTRCGMQPQNRKPKKMQKTSAPVQTSFHESILIFMSRTLIACGVSLINCAAKIDPRMKGKR